MVSIASEKRGDFLDRKTERYEAYLKWALSNKQELKELLKNPELTKRAKSRIREKINEPIPTDKQLKTLNRYAKRRKAVGKGVHNIYNQIGVLRRFALKYKKDWKDITKEDLEDYLADLKGKPNTKKIVIDTLKQFWKWLLDWPTDGYPPIVSWMEKPRDPDSEKLPEEMLEPQEVNQLIDACINFRDKCLISMLWEMGSRVSELLSLKIGSLTTNDNGYLVNIQRGKTGKRRTKLQLVESKPYINMFLQSHPCKADKKAPLFFSFCNQTMKSFNEIQCLGMRGVADILSKAAKRSGLKKRIYPHLLRHSRATFAAKVLHWNEGQMRVWFGWSKTSGMPGHYTAMRDSDVNSLYLSNLGLKPIVRVKEPDEYNPVVCWRCREPNPKNLERCVKCHSSLGESSKIIEDQEEILREMIKAEIRKELQEEKLNQEKV